MKSADSVLNLSVLQKVNMCCLSKKATQKDKFNLMSNLTQSYFIQRIESMIKSYLKGKTCKRNNGQKSGVVFINTSNENFTGNISFGRCFGDVFNFDFRQRRLYLLNW